MANGKEPLIICENLVKIYKVADLEVFALQGLDLRVERGEMLGIVGASGSGKSTFMNILGGLDRPSAGRITVDGLNLLTLPEHDLNEYQRSKVGFVWQQTTRNLIPYLTAQENVEMPMTMAWNTSTRDKHAWSTELLQAVGLYERRHHNLSQLSGGEQQRVAIAVALSNKPVLLLGDEPTGEVDSVTAQIVMDTFRRLGKLMDLTIITVTHDPRISDQVDRVVAIRDGKISTETIRQANHEEGLLGGESIGLSSREQVTYQEYVVLDAAGRLQIPKDVLEEMGFNRRAQLETGDNCIIVRPVLSEGSTGETKKLTLEEQLTLLYQEQAVPYATNRSRFMDHFHFHKKDRQPTHGN